MNKADWGLVLFQWLFYSLLIALVLGGKPWVFPNGGRGLVDQIFGSASLDTVLSRLRD